MLNFQDQHDDREDKENFREEVNSNRGYKRKECANFGGIYEES